VLRGLGWEILRIWSTDWWVNPGGTLERIHTALTALLEQDRRKRAAEVVEAPQAAAVAEAEQAPDTPEASQSPEAPEASVEDGEAQKA
jgi:hypothetical protein